MKFVVYKRKYFGQWFVAFGVSITLDEMFGILLLELPDGWRYDSWFGTALGRHFTEYDYKTIPEFVQKRIDSIISEPFFDIDMVRHIQKWDAKLL